VAEAPVTYRELPPPAALAPWVRCLWALTVQAEGDPGWVVPDGYMDLVASGPELHLAGPDTAPWPVRRRPGGVAVAVLERDPAAARVGRLGPAVGLGERQLRRRFHAGVGYGPKTLARILRFQRLLALLRDDHPGGPSLAEAAIGAGYADQAHMTAECTRLSGRSPAALVAGRPALQAQGAEV
jgi:AraC-like DNA-binding protein